MSATDIADEIELVPVEDLIPYSNNPKEHPDSQVKKIASSIKNYGWDQPIVVDGENEIIKGHGRMQAAELLGLDRVPVIRREDLTESQAKAARIADNKTAESTWDNELLSAELEILQEEQSIDIDSLGFDEVEIEGILDSANVDIDNLFEEDEEGADTDGMVGEGSPEVECPECGHTFEPNT